MTTAIDSAFIAALRSFPGWEQLSPRELEVLEGRMRGDSQVQVAARLRVARATIDTHISRVLAKLNYEGASRRFDRALFIAYGRALERQEQAA